MPAAPWREATAGENDSERVRCVFWKSKEGMHRPYASLPLPRYYNQNETSLRLTMMNVDTSRPFSRCTRRCGFSVRVAVLPCRLLLQFFESRNPWELHMQEWLMGSFILSFFSLCSLFVVRFSCFCRFSTTRPLPVCTNATTSVL